MNIKQGVPEQRPFCGNQDQGVRGQTSQLANCQRNQLIKYQFVCQGLRTNLLVVFVKGFPIPSGPRAAKGLSLFINV